MTTAIDVLGTLIDEKCWDAAADIERWQKERSRRASPLRALKHSIERRARPEVVLALTLGVIQRAHLSSRGCVSRLRGDYACVHEDATFLDTKDPGLCAALSIWLMHNPPPARC